ncbi:MAG: AAA family ATPase [Gammaproteobacteria bacterium]|nr:AAA family ATPase [Gammaproteobacteria bacterium]
MDSGQDLKLVLRSHTPIVAIESNDEPQLLSLMVKESFALGAKHHMPLFRWTITDGLQRLDIELVPQEETTDPEEVLKHIRSSRQRGIFVLLDFHPYLQDPLHVRLLKDIAIASGEVERTVVLLSHKLDIPPELEHFCVSFEMALPDARERAKIIREVAREWATDHPGASLQVDSKALKLLVRNLAGLTHGDTRRLARNAIYQDGAISKSDVDIVMQSKYQLLNREGVLTYEYDTARFSDVGGQERLKEWLSHRRDAFRGAADQLQHPKGVLLLGVQGCGKSLAAKAVAGIFGAPLLRLDFGRLFNKYHGESERNLRSALETAEVMSPCVLWIDEIEKSVAGGTDSSGTSQRILGTFLTWMAEKKEAVFVVATANDVSELPPELMRKGRFDEIFFVDLPEAGTREEILRVHLQSRDLDDRQFDVPRLAQLCDGFSGAELEQAIVAAMYAAHAQDETVSDKHLVAEIRSTYPLSVTMAEKISQLRRWARDRAVPVE